MLNNIIEMNLIDEAAKLERSTIIAGLIGALLSQIITSIVLYSKGKKDLRLKKKLIVTDLNAKKKILTILSGEYKKLKVQIEAGATDTFQSDAMNGLNIQLFESIPKTDLFMIYGADIVDVVEIYNSFQFLNRKSPGMLFKNLADKWSLHKQTAEHQNSHTNMCANYKLLLHTAAHQATLNIQTCTELEVDIDNALKSKWKKWWEKKKPSE